MPERDTAPVFAVVGHPNKGKSSLVATLAQDDSVGIGRDPGTTLQSRAYPMRVDGRLLYTLVDTPGFQRARQVLAWLESRAQEVSASAADRPRLVAEFVEDPESARRFPDETELLRPIVNGAGILYVVDGGVRYGPEYEAEMTILRWTGAPSMAIINPIVNANEVASWKAALSQFFRVVRVVNAVEADYSTRRRLLLAFGELETSWRAPIEAAVAALDKARDASRRAASREIAELLASSLAFAVERRLETDEESLDFKDALESEFKAGLERLEIEHRNAVQRIYHHHVLEAKASAIELLEQDLFSEDTWLTFGLRRRDLISAGAASGAATGGVIDVALGGASVLLGVATGAAVGGVLGFLGAGRLAEMKIVNRPLGGKLARFGPLRNPNFPFVLFGRARYHWSLVASRTHAMRDPVDLADASLSELPLTSAARKALEASFAKLRKSGLGVAQRIEARNALASTIEEILRSDEAESEAAADRS